MNFATLKVCLLNLFRHLNRVTLMVIICLMVNFNATGQAPYCGFSSNCSIENIMDVVLEQINHTGNGCNTGGYGDFTHMSATLIPGQTYDIFVHQDYTWQHAVTVYIDWQQTGTFDPGDIIASDNIISQTFTFTVPQNAIPGQTRMRVAMEGFGTPPVDPCGSPAYGEVHDYSIEIPPSDPPTANFFLPDTLYTGSNTLINPSNSMSFWSYEWQVNGSPVSQQESFNFNPQSPGTYNLTLIVDDGTNSDQITKTVVVVNPFGPPIANFIANKNLLFMGDSTRFTDLTTQAPDSWHWEIFPETTQIDPDPNFPPQPTYGFGQGFNSASQNPYVIFHYPGVYDVSLTASRGTDSDNETKSEYVTVAHPLGILFDVMEETSNPMGAFSDDGGTDNYGNNDGTFLIAPCADDLYIVFDEFELECGSAHLRIYDGTNDTTGIPLYDGCSTNGFTGGGGQSGCDQSDICLPPDTLHSETGRFYIVYEGGNNSENLSGFLARWGSTTKSTPPVAKFSAPEQVCTGDNVEFKNLSTGAGIASFKWDYTGNGIIADTTKDGSFSYQQPTTYFPQLIVEDCAGLADTFQTAVEALSPVAPTTITLDADNNEPWTNEDIVTLSASAQECISSFEWNITPGSFSFVEGSDQYSRNPEVIFHQPVCYDVQLIANNSNGSGMVIESCLVEARGYCTPVIGQTSEDIGISKVKLGSIDHTSQVGAVPYRNYSDDYSTNLRKGETYQITIQRTTTANTMDRAVWVDWNQNGSFDDTLELIAYESNAQTSSYTASFTVPGLAAEGQTRLRIGTSFGGTTLNSCGGHQFGEFADYGLNILPDVNAPEITLDGDNPLHLEVFNQYVEPGYSAWDVAYGDLTDEVVVDYSSVDTDQLGTYIVTYTVSDGDGNTTTKEREVKVVDTEDPTIELNGPDTLYVEVNTTFEDPGVTLDDNYWTNLTANVSSNLDMNVLDDYTVQYCVTDGSGNGPVCITRVVVVDDTTPPDIILPSDTIVTEVLEPINFDVIDITDNYWGADNIDVEVSGIDDVPDELGNFNVTITATDGSDNTGQAAFIVRVVDTTPPEIELNGSSIVNLGRGQLFDDPGVTVNDNFDPAPEIVHGGSFESTQSPGVYNITYYAVDQSGNQSETVARMIYVDPVNLSEVDQYNISVYPNPATNYFEVEVTGMNNNYTIVVTDLTGRTIHQLDASSTENQLHKVDMRGYAEGMYLVRVSDDHNSVIKKVNIVH